MLKSDLILQQELLKDLTPEQIAVIEKLSENDEKAVLATKTGNHAQSIEDDVLEATGIAKNQGEKYFDYMKRAFGDFKSKIDALEVVKTDLTEKLAAAGKDGDKALQTQLDTANQALADANQKIQAFDTQINELKTNHATEIANRDKADTRSYATMEIGAASKGLKPRDGMTQEEFDDILNVKTESILSKYVPEVVEGTGGNKLVQWRDSEGKLVLNPENSNSPFTTSELVSKSIGSFAATTTPKGGTGGKGGGQGDIISLVNAKSRDEARKAIESDLASRGIEKNSPTYREEFNKSYNTPEVKALPLEA